MKRKEFDPQAVKSLFGLTREEMYLTFAALMPEVKRYRADQIYDWFYNKREPEFAAMTNLPKALVPKLTRTFSTPTIELEGHSKSIDGTTKYLFRLEGDFAIETVLIPSEMRTEAGEPKRRTICVSTQVGCPLDCKFCATATMKLKRNLTAAEILLQVFETERRTAERITNLVFMGMGEPLLNLENVVRAIRILTDPKNELLGRRRITVSTSGLPEGIREFADLRLGVKLALSLHATNNVLRSKLMPINIRYPLTEVLAAMEYLYQQTREPVTYEYILFKDINDSDADAKALADICRRMPSKVNVIPFHPIGFANPGTFGASLQASPPATFDRFLNTLRSYGAQVMIRSSSGKDIDAACGQLALSRGHISEEPLLHNILL